MIEWLENRFGGSPLLPLLLAAVINGIALVLSSNYVDGDAHTRVYMALEWMRGPFLIVAPNDLTWVFGPLHCYLNALLLSVWYDPLLAPRVLSWFLTTLTILPLYGSLRMLFSRHVAFFSALLFCFYTLFVHAAAIAVSEGINLFLVFLSIWLFLRLRKQPSWSKLILCALSLLAASMMRYESWLLVTVLTIYLAIDSYRFARTGENDRKLSWIQVVAFALVAHGFAAAWLVASWLKFGDPLLFMHYSGNLDAPVIAKRVAEIGWLKYFLYNIAFLPGVMLLSMSVTSLALGIIGAWKTIRRDKSNMLLVILGMYFAFYLVTFVFSFERFPLARFTILPGAILLCFAGVGWFGLREKLSMKMRSASGLVVVVIPAVTLIVLCQFSQPSKVDWREKLRAVSPLTTPPDYFEKTANYLNDALADDGALVVDCRNYNDRLLYLYLSGHYESVFGRWSSTDELGTFIREQKPERVLYTSRPDRNHELVEDSKSHSNKTIAGVKYRAIDSAGIFTVYQLMER